MLAPSHFPLLLSCLRGLLCHMAEYKTACGRDHTVCKPKSFTIAPFRESLLTPSPSVIHPNCMWLWSLNCAELHKFEPSSVPSVGNGLEATVGGSVDITVHAVAEGEIRITSVHFVRF